jgi:hypothetical protein
MQRMGEDEHGLQRGVGFPAFQLAVKAAIKATGQGKSFLAFPQFFASRA